MRLVLETKRRRSRRTVRVAALGAATGVTLGWAGGFFFDAARGRGRGRQTADRAGGIVRRAWRRTARFVRRLAAWRAGTSQRLRHRRDVPKDLDDVTLAHKVETELFRSPDVPKGLINVNAQRGVVQLRGEVPSAELIDDLVERTRAVQGVLNVENLLHLPGTPAPMHQ
jgi:osmotically-inducible protein OsmY